MNKARVIGNNGDLFVAQRPLGFSGQIGAVKPHILGHQPTVVCEHPVIDIDKVL